MKSRLAVVAREPEGPDLVFNPGQWAKEHERLDDIRFRDLDSKVGSIFKVLGAGGMAILALLTWSLKAQYETMATQVQTSQVQIQTLREIQAQVAVHKPPE